MTRATVGGINAEDNLWYPLAVNSQGIAQIDTSGIPQPMEWKVKKWDPVYDSSDPEASAIIDYGDRTYGVTYLLGDICFVKFAIETVSCTITNPRGSLRVSGLPYTWLNKYQDATFAGFSLGSARFFRNNAFVVGGSAANIKCWFSFDKRDDSGEIIDLEYADLAETSGTSNRIRASYWGRITSEVTPARDEAIADMYPIAAENPTGTP